MDDFHGSSLNRMEGSDENNKFFFRYPLPTETDGWPQRFLLGCSLTEWRRIPEARGAQQQALVVLSPLHWPSLLTQILSVLLKAAQVESIGQQWEKEGGIDNIHIGDITEATWERIFALVAEKIGSWSCPRDVSRRPRATPLTVEYSPPDRRIQSLYPMPQFLIAMPAISPDIFRRLDKIPDPNRQPLSPADKEVVPARTGRAGMEIFPDISVYRPWKSLLSFLPFLWELLIAGESLMILANSAARASEAVLSLVSLLSPLLFAGDFRPFLSSFDPHFAVLSEHYGIASPDVRASPQSNKLGDMLSSVLTPRTPPSSSIPMLLGLTNPLGLQTMSRFPHQIALEVNQKILPEVVPLLECRRQDTTGSSYSWIATRVKPVLSSSSTVAMKLARECLGTGATEASESMNSAAIRRYFLSLTLSFLKPIEEQLQAQKATCVSQVLINPLLPIYSQRETPTDHRFWIDTASFFVSLPSPARHTPLDGLPISKLQTLYRLFFGSPHFSNWMEERRIRIEDDIATLRVNSIVSIDAASAVSSLTRDQLKSSLVEMEHLLERRSFSMIPSNKETLVKLVNRMKEKLRSW